MEKRSYYQDAYTHTFEAKIIENVEVNGRPAVILDHSFFYPTSGGQPHDTGLLNSVSVLDVLVRPEDDAVLHVLDEDLIETLALNSVEATVSAQINWDRRFDHMQQHSGQHILSQAFIQVAKANTIGFHLSSASVTIDLDTSELSTAQITQVEALSNQIIWENRPITIQIVTQTEAQNMAIRKLPVLEKQLVRLIEIADFDLTACGGTHVAATGAVGLLKIVKVERRGTNSRITFVCGRRALADYQQKHFVVSQLMAQLTTGADELETAVGKLQDNNKSASRELKKQQTQLDQYAANELRQQATKVGGYTIVTHVFTDRDPGSLRNLGNQFVAVPGTIALLATSNNDKTHLIFCRAADAPGQMNTLLKSALAQLGSRSGGGSPNIAQGVAAGCGEIPKEGVETAVANAAETIVEEINRIG
ncbi:MAG: hypothetical protein KDE48_08405 [Anaerolineales bacterium]|nr:hypothetical protein [Anaerolineales bacterium]